MKINIIARDNSAGITADREIITEILKNQGWEVLFSDYKSLKRFSYWAYHRYDINLFLQWANPTWLKLGKKNILIPNPEFFKAKWSKSLYKFDGIFCKTKHAVTLFEKYNGNVVFTSFTSKNKYLHDTPKKNDKWLHAPGKSKLKGTDVVIETWLKNPHFPHLTIVQRNAPQYKGLTAPNLTYIPEFIDAKELQYLMNECPIHICPSAAEGFGHYIGEALSCGAIIITTDSAPMNELVTKERGVLIEPVNMKKMSLSYASFIDKNGLEKAVKKIIHISSEEKERLMKNSLSFYRENDNYFRSNVINEIKKLKSDSSPK